MINYIIDKSVRLKAKVLTLQETNKNHAWIGVHNAVIYFDLNNKKIIEYKLQTKDEYITAFTKINDITYVCTSEAIYQLNYDNGAKLLYSYEGNLQPEIEYCIKHGVQIIFGFN